MHQLTPRRLPFIVAVVTALVIVCTSAGTAHAQGGVASLADAEFEDLLNRKITTASRTTETVGDAPARVEVITAAQIERRGYRSLVDVLRDLPDFKVDSGGDPDYPYELVVQGSRGASNLIVLFDGLRISSPTNEPLPILANYPVHNARQVEVVYGPASALYGADAFAAVVNIITYDALDRPGLTASTSLGQYGLTSDTVSYGRRLGSRAGFVASGQWFYDRQPDLSRYYPEAFGGLTGQRTGLFNTIFGPMTPQRPVSPAFDIPTSAHSLQAALTVGRLRLTGFESRSRISTAPATNPDNTVYNRDAANLNRLLMGAGSYARTFGPVTATWTALASRHVLDPQSGYWNTYSGFERSYKYAYGSLQKLDQQFQWRWHDLRFATGQTYERFFAIPQTADLAAPIRSQATPGVNLGTTLVDQFYKIRYQNIGGFGQVQYAWTPQVLLTLGLRGDRNTRYGVTWNPRAGVVMEPTASTTVKLLYGTAFLAPSPYQTYAHYGSFYSTDDGATYQSDYWHIPNPNLKPQLKRTLELHALEAVNPTFMVSGSAFVSRLTHMIKPADADQAYSGAYLGWPASYIDFPVNQGDETLYGGTVDLRLTRTFARDHRVEARAALTYVDGSISEQGDSVRDQVGGMAPWQFHLTTDVDWGKWRLAPRVAVMSRQRLFAFAGEPSTKRATLPGYATTDVTIRRRLGNAFELFGMAENLFDQRYRTINTHAILSPEELVGAPQNPRRLTAGLSVHLP